MYPDNNRECGYLPHRGIAATHSYVQSMFLCSYVVKKAEKIEFPDANVMEDYRIAVILQCDGISDATEY